MTTTVDVRAEDEAPPVTVAGLRTALEAAQGARGPWKRVPDSVAQVFFDAREAGLTFRTLATMLRAAGVGAEFGTGWQASADAVRSVVHVHRGTRANGIARRPKTATGAPREAELPDPLARLLSQLLDSSGDWRHRGACLDEDPELFFPIGNSALASAQAIEAKGVCAGCVVRGDCLQWAVDSGLGHGIAGGLDEEERIAYRRNAKRREMRARGAL